MQFKPITAILILLLIVTSLSITGCTNNTTNTATSPSPQAHDATLERYVNVTKQAEYNNKTKEILAWLVTWNNDSSVTILETVKNRTDNSSVSGNTTLINFQSNQDATNYLNAFDKSDYSLISTSFKTSDAPTLRNVTGHEPSVYAEYLKTEGSIFDLTYKATVLMQYDNIIAIQSAKLLSLGSGVSSGSSNQSIPGLISIPSTSVTATTTPTAKATAATPTPLGKVTTTIQFASDPTVAKGGTLFINVLASGFTICGHGAVTATIGTISSEGSSDSDCFHTAFLDTSGLSQGTHAITLTFSGDSTYQASQLSSTVTIT
jgi:hypothetical protein